MATRSIVAGIFLLGVVPFAHAQTIHRCVDAEGRVAYSSDPCAANSKQQKQIEVKISPADPDAAAASQDWQKKSAEFDQRRAQRKRAEAWESAQAAQQERSRKAAEDRAKSRQAEMDRAARERGEIAAARRNGDLPGPRACRSQSTVNGRLSCND